MHVTTPLGLRKTMCRNMLPLLLALSPHSSLALQENSVAPHPAASLDAQTRLALRRSLGEQARQQSAAQARHISLDGHSNPELFLPLELFNEVVVRFLAADRPAEATLAIQGRGRLLGVTDHHWELLAAATARLRLRDAEVRRNLTRIAQEGAAALDAVDGELSAYGPERCALLDEAFQAATRQMGERFLGRLLYEVIAPMTTMTLDASCPRPATSVSGML